MRHSVVFRGFSVPSGYLMTTGGSYAGGVSCWSNHGAPDVQYSFSCEDLTDDRVGTWKECYHSYLDGVLYQSKPDIINPNDIVPMYGTNGVVLARYSTGYALVYTDTLWDKPSKKQYQIVEYNRRMGYWTLVARFYPGGVTKGTGYVGNYTNIALSHSGTASYDYKDDRSITNPNFIGAEGSVSYVGDGKFSITGRGASTLNGIYPGVFIGDITVLNVMIPSGSDAEDTFASYAAAERALRLKYLFENREAVEQNVIDCILQADYFDLNMIAFLRDFKEFKETLTSLKNLLKGKVNLKNVSSLLLVKKYVVETTARDIDDIIEQVPVIIAALRSHQNQMRTLRFHTRSNSTSTLEAFVLSGLFDPKVQMREATVCTLYLNPKAPYLDGITDFIRILDKFDALPTLENLWDLVPYSFVVDWFIDFGSNLEALSADRKTSQYNLVSHIYSQRNSAALTATGQWSGIVNFDYYQRHVSYSWPGFKFRLNFSLPFSHILELGALIVQRIK